MDYKKIIEDYQKILKDHEDCEKTFDEEYKKLTDSIDILLSDQSNEKHSKYFSDLFKIWDVASNETIESLMPENKTQATKNNVKDQDILLYAKKSSVQALLQFSSLQQVDELKDSKKIIEYTLELLWKNIFKARLEFLSPTIKASNFSKEHNHFNQNWPLYELINQIGNILDSSIKKEGNKEIIISDLAEEEKNEIILNSEIFCNYILDGYIFNSNKLQEGEKWLPNLKNSNEVQLSHIIATSNLVGYIFNYKLMDDSIKTNYINQVEHVIHLIFEKLIHRNVIYDAMVCYISEHKEKEIVSISKDQTFCPKIIFIFIIAIIQEIITQSLTKNKINIFHTIKGGTRLKGIDEKSIIKKIKQDSEIYMQFYSYLKNSSSRTMNRNKKSIETWIKNLNNLKFGILDDDLYKLSEATKMSFEEETVTSIKTHTPDNSSN